MLSSALLDRDALLSRLGGVRWPYEPLLDALALAPELDVLDIGAGAGGLLHELRRRGHTGRTAGIDPNPLDGVQQGTAQSLPYPEASFDVVFLLRVLAHIPEPALALAEARRVLRPSGKIVMAAHGADHLRAFWTRAGQPPAAASANKSDLDIRLPIQLGAQDAEALAKSYGLSLRADGFPVTDQLHLVVKLEKL